MAKDKNKKSRAHIKYTLNDGTKVVGVTTVTGILDKPALIAWANRIGLEGIEVGKYVDDKASVGTLAHAMVTDFLMDKKTDTSDYSQNQIDQAENASLSFFEWMNKHDIKPIFVERPFVHEQFKYGGQIDIYATVDGKLELIDLKTGSGIWPEHYLQTSAYKELLEHGHELGSPAVPLDTALWPVDQIRILNIPRAETETFLEAIVPVPDKQFEVFKHLLQVYYLRKNLKGE